MQELVTYLTLQAPGGLIGIRAECGQGKVNKVTVENLPSFASQLNATLEISGLGSLQVDTAFGGDSFVIVDTEDLGFKLLPEEAHHIVKLGF